MGDALEREPVRRGASSSGNRAGQKNTRTVAEKMGLRAGMRALLRDAPDAALQALSLPALETSRSLRGQFDYLHLFATSQAAMEASFPMLAKHLAPRGMLWMSWPKGGRLGTDLSLPHVIRIGYSHGLVESTTLRVDATWSAMKFTHPKAGKIYRNSYGQLPSRAPDDDGG